MTYQISSGQGPVECELGVAKFLEYLTKNYSVTVLETSKGYHEGTYCSVKLSSEMDLSNYEGSVQWICRSPYRPAHKRKNWFLNFSACETAGTEDFDPKQIVFETFRSGGKGGQNVNKVESGVRAIYLPTGQAVECTEERSQYANKQKAVARLREIIKQRNFREQATVKHSDWKCHTRLERGNAGAVFVGMEFKKK